MATITQERTLQSDCSPGIGYISIIDSLALNPPAGDFYRAVDRIFACNLYKHNAVAGFSGMQIPANLLSLKHGIEILPRR